jgi:hypothetical protein
MTPQKKLSEKFQYGYKKNAEFYYADFKCVEMGFKKYFFKKLRAKNIRKKH